ncbi:hypothetical protein ACJQWK_06347 [Exserohilum turcicum]
MAIRQSIVTANSLPIMVALSVALTTLFALSISASPCVPNVCPEKVGAEGVQVRLPPEFNVTSPQQDNCPWRPLPVGFFFKPWYIIVATNPQYVTMRNIQYDPTPVDPSDITGQVNDLFSFQIPGNETVYTTYGVDTPRPGFVDLLDFRGTGIIANATSEFSILFWGCDADYMPYYGSYSTATAQTKTPPGLDVLSTNYKGPDQGTLDAILKGLKDLGSEEITGLVNKLNTLKHDTAKRNLPNATCDDYCKTNLNLVSILSAASGSGSGSGSSSG